MKINSTAIYDTHPIAPYKENNICLTQNDNGNVFLFYLAGEGETKMPEEITVTSIQPKKGTKISLLGTKYKLRWKNTENGFIVTIPDSIRKNPPAEYAWVFKIDRIE